MLVPRRLRSFRRRSVLTALAGILVLAAIGVAQTAFGRNVTRHLGISAPGEPYTELYFSDPQQLVTLVRNPQKGLLQQRPGFVIRNDQHVSVDYHWVLDVSGVTQTQGEHPLGPAQQVYISPAVTLNCADARRPDPRGPRELRVSVTVDHPRESIGYLVNCGG